jgi:hypothetical protein
MMPHVRYLAYVLRHKWFVFWGCMTLGIPLWRALVHDWTKFTPAEWGPYVRRFYGPNGYKPAPGSKGYDHNQNKGQDTAFDNAWKHHWQHNPHHPEYWTVKNWQHAGSPDEWGSSNGELVQPMPETYTREMVADWYGAGMAQGKPDIYAWYIEGRDRRKIHPDTYALVDQIVDEARIKGLFA